MEYVAPKVPIEMLGGGWLPILGAQDVATMTGTSEVPEQNTLV
jgi:hypothetical protein